MYREFIILIWDYFRSLRFEYVIYEWVIPIILALIAYHNVRLSELPEMLEKFGNNTVALLGVLIGFSITVITILTTSSSKNVEQIKGFKTKTKIGGQNLSLFQVFLTNLSYSVVIEIIWLIINLILPIIKNSFSSESLLIILSVNLLFVVHVLLLTIRNITDFYLILFKK